jgi:hypothetical protein
MIYHGISSISITEFSKNTLQGAMIAVQNLLNKHISNGFAEFEGLNITGCIPIKQEVINEFITEILQNGIKPPSQSQLGSSSSSKPNINMHDLLKLIKRVEVRVDEGKIILEFEVEV